MTKPRGDLWLAVGYWIVSHKQQFRTWWAVLLLGFVGLSTVWVLVFFSIWFIQQPKLDAEVRAAAEAVKIFSPAANVDPLPLEAGAVTIIARDTQHIDLVATLTNPNEDWGASEVTYRFVVDNVPLAQGTAFVNPGSSRPLIQLNQTKTGQLATLEIIDTIWKRKAAVVMPAATFAVDSPKLTSTTVRLGEQSFLTVRMETMITNRSVYDFVKVTVPIILKHGDQIVAVDEQTLDRWESLARKPLTATWPFAISQATTAEVVPQVSQFDSNNLF
jgi:hypothetical protein